VLISVCAQIPDLFISLRLWFSKATRFKKCISFTSTSSVFGEFGLPRKQLSFTQKIHLFLSGQNYEIASKLVDQQKEICQLFVLQRKQ